LDFKIQTFRNGLKGDDIISIGLMLLANMLFKETVFQELIIAVPQTLGMEKRSGMTVPENQNSQCTI
jgi:hypothetical protein